MHGNYSGTIHPNCPLFTRTTGQCGFNEPDIHKRCTVCLRKRMQMEGITEQFRKLAYSIRSNEQVGEEWHIKVIIRRIAKATNHNC